MKRNQNQKHKEQTKNLVHDGNCLSEENFKIYLRVKPILASEPHKQSIKILNNQKIEVIQPYYAPQTDNDKFFQYEEVFDGKKSNNQIFEKTMIDPIINVLSGFNSTVFIYGMTGAGKTYTMFGENAEHSQEGLVSMTIDYLFDQIYQSKDIKSQVHLSFFQIYNQNIRDLLHENSQNLAIMEDPVRGIIINDLIETQVEEITQAQNLISCAINRRAMNATASNEISSRSHAILQFTVRRYFEMQNNQVSMLQSKFFMIDLAGNEKTSNNQNKRFIQGVNINKSLLTLGKCISILSERKNTYVPFRESKLTRILKQSLGGNSKTVMIACISPEKKFYQQTLNTLKYSSLAKRIKNKGIKTNAKIISKSQMPFKKQCITLNQNCKSEQERKVIGVLGQFIDLMEEKFQLEKVLNDLEHSRALNQKLMMQQQIDLEIGRKNLKKTNDYWKKINQLYDENLTKCDKIYKNLLNQIVKANEKMKINLKNKQNQRQEINHLNEIINIQKIKIKQLEQSIKTSQDHTMVEHFNSCAQLDSIRQSQRVNMSLTSNQKQNRKTPQNTFRNFSNNYKNLKIDVSLGDESNISIAEKDQTLLSDSLRQTKRKDEKKNNKLQKQIVINLNSCRPNQLSVLRDKQGNKDRDAFVNKLRQAEKKVKRISQSQISILLEEQEMKKYQLGNVEMSMIRKLKFFQREKSLEKSHSLTGISNRTSCGKRALKY